MSETGVSAARFPDPVCGHPVRGNPGSEWPEPENASSCRFTPDLQLAAGYPIVVAGVTGTLPDPLTADYVRLP